MVTLFRFFSSNLMIGIILLGGFSVSSAAIQTGSLVHVAATNTVNIPAGHTVNGVLFNVPGNVITYGTQNNGGEFLISELGGTESIISFCLEQQEAIAKGGTFLATINQGAMHGGIGGGPANNYYDPLSQGTKLLYGRFYEKSLTGSVLGGNPFNYSNNGWADALQLVIWALEQEITLTTNQLNNAKVNALWTYGNGANSRVLTPGELAIANKVSVMNLWQTSYNFLPGDFARLETDAAFRASLGSVNVQSQLFYGVSQIPPPNVPEPATLVIWGALSAFAATGYRWRRAVAGN